jgi:hypothetical protein
MFDYMEKNGLAYDSPAMKKWVEDKYKAARTYDRFKKIYKAAGSPGSSAPAFTEVDAAKVEDISGKQPEYFVSDLDHGKFLAMFNENHKLNAKWNSPSLNVNEYSLSVQNGSYTLRHRQKDKVTFISKSTQENSFLSSFKSRYRGEYKIEGNNYMVQELAWRKKPWDVASIKSLLSATLKSKGADNTSFRGSVSISGLSNGYYTISISYRDEPKSEAVYSSSTIALTDGGRKYVYNKKEYTIPHEVRKTTAEQTPSVKPEEETNPPAFTEVDAAKATDKELDGVIIQAKNEKPESGVFAPTPEEIASMTDEELAEVIIQSVMDSHKTVSKDAFVTARKKAGAGPAYDAMFDYMEKNGLAYDSPAMKKWVEDKYKAARTYDRFKKIYKAAGGQ